MPRWTVANQKITNAREAFNENKEEAKKVEAATKAVGAAEEAKTDATKKVAQDLVTALKNGAEKDALQVRLNKIETVEDTERAATNGVEELEALVKGDLTTEENLVAAETKSMEVSKMLEKLANDELSLKLMPRWTVANQKITNAREAFNENKAVQAINSATSETMGQAINENAEILGLDLTEYNKLSNKTSVESALIGKNFENKTEVKEAFDNAVKAE